MQRRRVLRTIGTAGALAVGASGLASAESSTPDYTHVYWEFDDGHTETLELLEFHHRDDTPSLRDLDPEDTCSATCCDCIECDTTCTGGLCGSCTDCVGCGCCDKCDICS